MTNVEAGCVLELVVMALQVVGVFGLCIYRLVPGSRWADRGRAAFIMSLLGLGVAGAMCSWAESEFALFAGGTMTALLIGVVVGSGGTEEHLDHQPTVIDPSLVG